MATSKQFKPYGNPLYSNADVCLRTIPSYFLAMRQIPITSTVSVEVMYTNSSVGSTVEGFHTPSLSKHAGKPDYATIKEIHQLLTANLASVESNLGEGQNGYLRLTLPPKQYYRISGTDFVRPTNPGRTATVPT